MIVLFTDFGADDLYVGQVKAVLLQSAPGVPVIDLLHRAPNFSPRPAAHLLAALCRQFPPGSVFLAVVDPGVGSARQAVLVEADGRYFLGPDNGLLSVLASRAGQCRYWRITWQPAVLSASFHGRDLFAPMAAALAKWRSGSPWPVDRLQAITGLQVDFGAADLAEIIYLDHYGNAFTGLRAASLADGHCLAWQNQAFPLARTFSDLAPGQAFCYANSLDLLEIALNQASAAAQLGLHLGATLRIVPAEPA